jgi:YegS/Rv2252/BmrU family lipid kinase
MDRTTRWVAIQRNPRSGSGRRAALHEFIRELRSRGLRVRLFSSRDRLDRAVADPELRASLHALVAAGGDGTAMDLINRHPDLPLGIMPLGTENLLARHFHIPLRNGRAAADIVAKGRTQSLDIGSVDGRRFAVMASVGFDAEVIHRAHAVRRGHITRLHYARPILGALGGYSQPQIRVYADDAAEPVTGALVVVANLSAYALRLKVVPTARGDDGLFDVRVFRQGSAFHILRYLFMVAAGVHDRSTEVVSLQAKRVRIEADTAAPIQADGDPAGHTPCELNVTPAAARIIVPD